MQVVVRTFLLATGEQTDERPVAFNTAKGREWLAKHMWYCFCNGYGVQALNCDDEPQQISEAAE